MLADVYVHKNQSVIFREEKDDLVLTTKLALSFFHKCPVHPKVEVTLQINLSSLRHHLTRQTHLSSSYAAVAAATFCY